MDWGNKTFKLSDGVIHINPPILEESRDTLKVLGNDYTFYYGEYDKDAGLVGDQVITHVLGIILAQNYSVQKGIKLFGDRAKQLVTKELKQLRDMKTYETVHTRELTRQERKDVLSSLMFLTEKRCGKLKSHACANGSTQREYIKKEDAASPTVSGDSVMITSAIDAHEDRKIATLDIPGAFLYTDLDENVVMILRGPLAELMVGIDPELYTPFMVTTSKNEKILYVKMLKAIYGLLRSALLFYLKLVRDLKEYGFKLNPYDPCVANKMINGKQMAVTWHVDDLKVSHASDLKITRLIVFLGKKYGNKITVKCGNHHDYLGMDLDYTHQGMVKMLMINHIKRIFHDFPEDIGKSSTSPASDHLFQIRDPEETEKLGRYLGI